MAAYFVLLRLKSAALLWMDRLQDLLINNQTFVGGAHAPIYSIL
jgi:hypothetical protein